MDYAKLRGRIREKYGTEQAFAEAMGFSASMLSNRLLDKTPWASDEISKAGNLLGLTGADYYEYFFSPKSC